MFYHGFVKKRRYFQQTFLKERDPYGRYVPERGAEGTHKFKVGSAHWWRTEESRPLSEREKINVNKNNFNSVLSEFNPEVNLSVQNSLAGDGSEENVKLSFSDIKDFEPEQVARQIPQLRAMLAMRNLLSDLKSNLLDNATFRKELEKILKDPALSQELRDEMSALAPK